MDDPSSISSFISKSFSTSLNASGLEISRDLGLTRSRVQKYPPLDLIESGKEVLFVVSAENQGPTQLLISGSNIALEASKPSLILSFMRRSD